MYSDVKIEIKKVDSRYKVVIFWGMTETTYEAYFWSYVDAWKCVTELFMENLAEMEKGILSTLPDDAFISDR